MIFPLYDKVKTQYMELGEAILDLIREEEELFQRTQPKAVDVSRVKVFSSPRADAMARYIEAKEQAQIEERKIDLTRRFEECENLKVKLKQELSESPNIMDKVYYLWYEKGLSAIEIGERTGYSDKHIYRIKSKINETCEQMRKAPC